MVAVEYCGNRCILHFIVTKRTALNLRTSYQDVPVCGIPSKMQGIITTTLLSEQVPDGCPYNPDGEIGFETAINGLRQSCGLYPAVRHPGLDHPN